MKNTISDVTKTILPGGIVIATIHATDIKADLEIALLALSIIYTAIRLIMLIKRLAKDRAVTDEDDEIETPL